MLVPDILVISEEDTLYLVVINDIEHGDSSPFVAVPFTVYSSQCLQSGRHHFFCAVDRDSESFGGVGIILSQVFPEPVGVEEHVDAICR